MRENTQTTNLCQALRDIRFETFKHSGQTTGAVPDISTTGDGSTTWVEVKLLRRKEALRKGPQMINMCRLERAGKAVYVLYYSEEAGGKQTRQTLLVSPNEVWGAGGRWWEIPPLALFSGFAHARVADMIKQSHQHTCL